MIESLRFVLGVTKNIINFDPHRPVLQALLDGLVDHRIDYRKREREIRFVDP
jgi:MoxR-like ATPase